jgi:hypothetical protein
VKPVAGSAALPSRRQISEAFPIFARVRKFQKRSKTSLVFVCVRKFPRVDNFRLRSKLSFALIDFIRARKSQIKQAGAPVRNRQRVGVEPKKEIDEFHG